MIPVFLTDLMHHDSRLSDWPHAPWLRFIRLPSCTIDSHGVPVWRIAPWTHQCLLLASWTMDSATSLTDIMSCGLPQVPDWPHIPPWNLLHPLLTSCTMATPCPCLTSCTVDYSKSLTDLMHCGWKSSPDTSTQSPWIARLHSRHRILALICNIESASRLIHFNIRCSIHFVLIFLQHGTYLVIFSTAWILPCNIFCSILDTLEQLPHSYCQTPCNITLRAAFPVHCNI